RAIWETLRADARRLAVHAHVPAPRVSESLPLASASDDGGEAASADLLVVVGPEHVHIARFGAIAVREGRVEALDVEDPEGHFEDLSVPPESSDEVEPIDALVERLGAIELAPDAVVAVSAAYGTPVSRLQRVLASMVLARRAPQVVVQRASDDTLRAAPIQLVDQRATGAPGDAIIAVLPEGYALSESGRAIEIPRVAGMSTAPLDAGALAGAIGSSRGRRLIVDARGAVEAFEVIDTVFRAGRRGEVVGLLVGR
nr:hypothetical protein [Myxococcota bacterium]